MQIRQPRLISHLNTGLALLILSAPMAANADWWGGIDAGYYSWNPSSKGTLGTSEIDVQTELGLNKQSQGVIWFAIEHLDAFYPNLRFENTTIEAEGTGNIATQKTLRRAAFDGPITNDISFASNDLTAYYQMYDNFITLDGGITIRSYDGYIFISREDGLLSEKASFSDFVPMVFVKANIDIPLKGWYIDTVFNGISYDRTTLTDVTAKVGWKHEFELFNYSHIGAEVGYRHQKINLHQVDDLNTDISFDGGFLGINLRLGF